ncbi:cyclic-AMP phosphodiesterase [Suillus occidentalis]|nr:cyclic-AMP phosphodiesterase [Suillus occidentalis]
MAAFEMVVVGSGGGPDETNLSGYLLKPHNASWKDGIIALEAGSGLGALRHIMRRDPYIFRERPTDTPVTPLTVYSNVKCFLVTHAHLDHISSLVITAGALGGGKKRIYGSSQALRDLETIFSGRVWPRLASNDENSPYSYLVYHALHAESPYKVIFPNISVRLMTINHGMGLSGVYDGACYFIRHDPTNREFIFFGDVEPDSICAEPKNIAVWRAAAPKIPHDISTIFIECSYQIGRPVAQLWGHLSPEHLVQELLTLATEVVIARQARGSWSQRMQHLPAEALHGALRGVKVYITHCKEHFCTERPINHVIGDECRELLAPHRLGVELLTADQGMKIVF